MKMKPIRDVESAGQLSAPTPAVRRRGQRRLLRAWGTIVVALGLLMLPGMPLIAFFLSWFWELG